MTTSTKEPRELESQEDIELADRMRHGREQILAELRKLIVGQDEVVEQVLLTLFVGGHSLLIGVPGLAKTLLVHTMARVLDLKFSRIQFTPDLMPSDITGTDIIQDDPETGRRRMVFLPGPVFANIVLADEINRTPPKTQSALLEAMQERRVTIQGRTYELEPPFHVFATQNPIELEGTYPLPEAQLDRFMFEIRIEHLPEEEELEVVRATTAVQEPEFRHVVTGPELVAFQRLVRRVPAADAVIRYALALTRATRPPAEDGRGGTGAGAATDGKRGAAGGKRRADGSRGDDAPALDFIRDWVSYGASVRAAQYLMLGAKARAITHGRYHASFEDVRALARPVLRHRILTNFHAQSERVTTDMIIDRLLEAVPMPRSGL
ncbi:MAG TPA: AAA family ATPase [Longimicrobiales bacterium]